MISRQKRLDDLLRRRFFYLPSFEIYGGVAGLYDFGPPGCAMKHHIIEAWRDTFIVHDHVLEIDCAVLTPEAVLKASGHVSRFTDYVVKDTVTGDVYRADHLLSEVLGEHEVEGLSQEDLGRALFEHKVHSPQGNPVTKPLPYNLMFATSIGAVSQQPAFLRPETAQGIFANFKQLLYYNGGKLPLAAAQIGQSYRNEVSPRNGLLRVRDFTQAEIEYFHHSGDSSHPRFEDVRHLSVHLCSKHHQYEKAAGSTKELADAVSEGWIQNEAIAFYIGKTYQFCKSIGIALDKLRFRQHFDSEMAHYAKDCWDAEILTEHGWIECAGIADRAAFDLTAHSVASGVDLSVHDLVSLQSEFQMKLNKREIGMMFRKDAKIIVEHLQTLNQGSIADMQAIFDCGGAYSVKLNGSSHQITNTMVQICKQHKKTCIPHVIEPSFGIGRFLYCVLEHSFACREADEQRTFLKLLPRIAPFQVSVSALVTRTDISRKASQLGSFLQQQGLAMILDVGGTSIGKKYARTDELGVPYGVTVDHQSLEDDTVTIRDRDSMQQIRVGTDSVYSTIINCMSCSSYFEGLQKA